MSFHRELSSGVRRAMDAPAKAYENIESSRRPREVRALDTVLDSLYYLGGLRETYRALESL